MLISAREAARRLEKIGVSRRHARRVLAAGFAGQPLGTTSALLFDDALVGELLDWPSADDGLLDRTCPRGLFIARREVDLLASRAEQVDLVSDGWDLSPYSRVLIRVRIEQHGHFPFVATLAGFVALGAEITGVLVCQDGRTKLVLRDPGSWFDALRRHRHDAGPGNRWVLRRGMGESGT